MTNVLLPLVALIMMNAVWAGSYTVMKFGTATLSPLSIVFLREFFALLALSAWMLFSRKWQKLTRDQFLRIAASGVFAAAAQLLTVTGVQLSRAGNASLLYAFEPILGIVLAVLILKEKARPAYFLAMLLAAVGLFVLSGPRSGFFSDAISIGNLLVVAGITCEVFLSIVLKPVSGKVSSLQVMMLSLLFATILLSAPMAITRSSFNVDIGRDLLVIGYLSLICTALGYTLWVKVMGKLPVSLMYFTLFVQPITGPIIAWTFLGEKPDAKFIAAAIFLIFGMAVAIFSFLNPKGRHRSQMVKQLEFDGNNVV